MRKPISFFFALVILFEATLPGMEVAELNKIPALISHFQHHQKQDNTISFLDFIILHYNSPDHHDQDPVTHHNLPFSDHHSHNCQLQQAIFTLPDHGTPPTPECRLVKSNTLYTTPGEIFVYSSIWQPPRRTC